jgi:alanine racemase
MQSNGFKTWVEIDSKAYSHNIESLRSLLLPGVIFCSVIKANAYGHDLEIMVKLGIDNNINCFAVDSVDEAQRVRKISKDCELYILGYIPPEKYADAILSDAIITVYDEQTISELAKISQKLQYKCLVNIKCETGTNRQGVLEKDFKHLLASIEKTRGNINLHSLSSHFSCSEDTNKQLITELQNNKFDIFINECKKFGFSPNCFHISCSASALLYKNTQRSMVRFGIAQYGYWPSNEVRDAFTKKHPTFRLKPILTWKTKVAQIKDIQSGVSVGYNQKFISDRPMRIAILPIGYYDGLVRSYSNNGYVIIRSHKCQIIGNICMNMCMVNISSVPQVNIGDDVIIIGHDNIHSITAENHATSTNTIHYEVVTRISEHISRIIV